MKKKKQKNSEEKGVIYLSSPNHSLLLQIKKEFEETPIAKLVTLAYLASKKQFTCHKCESDRPNCTPNYQEIKDEIIVLEEVFENHFYSPEEFSEKCNQLLVCPYYMAVRMQHKADIVLLPTLLLFSPKSRGSFKFEITSNMVIIDEAHLSPDIACAACSLEVDLAKLKQFLREHLPRL